MDYSTENTFSEHDDAADVDFVAGSHVAEERGAATLKTILSPSCIVLVSKHDFLV